MGGSQIFDHPNFKNYYTQPDFKSLLGRYLFRKAHFDNRGETVQRGTLDQYFGKCYNLDDAVPRLLNLSLCSSLPPSWGPGHLLVGGLCQVGGSCVIKSIPQVVILSPPAPQHMAWSPCTLSQILESQIKIVGICSSSLSK